MSKSILSIQNVLPVFRPHTFTQPINWQINEGEHWAIIGPNGAGKSQMIDIVMGKQAIKSGEIQCLDNLSVRNAIKYVAFTNIYSFIDVRQSYYQQRWNIGEEQTASFVKDIFESVACDTATANAFISLFGIETLMEKRVNMLSSGELRKTLIVLSLLSNPKILILDNPYIGLDAKSRGALNETFAQLARLNKVQIVLIVTNPADIPPIITHVLPLQNRSVYPFQSRNDFLANSQLIKTLFDKEIDEITFPAQPSSSNSGFKNVLIFKNVSIKYGTKTILENVNWTVRRGEKWLLQGENGSGKSTLLSLIFCDNPQSYANDITLFDRKRGVGQSIWEVKSRIGFISPELTLYYRKNISCLEVVASGFFDTIGAPRSSNPQQQESALLWMRLFQIEYLRETPFLSVSTGERQLVLLARAFVKTPDLLVMDEPLHGLDINAKKHVNNIISAYCTSEKSLIYVTHYEEEIPPIIEHRMILEKHL